MPERQIPPTRPIKSLEELFAIAHAMEIAAAARYAGLAADMRALGLSDVAAAFEHLMAEENRHADAVEHWSHEATGASPDPSRIRWPLPSPFDEEAVADIASSRLATAYRALSMAVRNEERAFILWTHIAALAGDARIRKAAEAVAMQELDHAALLRRERRRAFHAARRDGERTDPTLSPEAAAGRVELQLSVGLAGLAEAPAFAPHRNMLRRLATEATAMATVAGASPAATLAIDPELTGMRRLAEQAAELYLAAADIEHDEDALLRLQSLAKQAVSRIAVLGTVQEAG